MKKSLIIFLALLSFIYKMNGQNYIGGGLNVGYRTTGFYLDYLFLKRFELQIGNEFIRYNGFGAFAQLRGYVYKTNTDNRSVYLSCAINQSFQHTMLILYNDVFYKYKFNDNYYIIPGVGYKFSNSNNKNSFLKYGYTCINVNYRFNMMKNEMYRFIDTNTPNPDVEKNISNYLKGGIGVYLSIGVSLGRKSKEEKRYER